MVVFLKCILTPLLDMNVPAVGHLSQFTRICKGCSSFPYQEGIITNIKKQVDETRCLIVFYFQTHFSQHHLFTSLNICETIE